MMRLFFCVIVSIALLSGAPHDVVGFSTRPAVLHHGLATTPSSCAPMTCAQKGGANAHCSAWSETLLFGCRSRRRNRHNKDHADDRLATLDDIPTRKSRRWAENIFDTLDAFEHWHYVHKQRRKRRKHLWILYTVGFFATFPVGPLLFLAIRNRHAIRQDLGLRASGSSSNWRFSSSDSTIQEDNADLIEQSRQVDRALRDSMNVLKSIREGITFDETLVQRFDNQIEQLHDKAKTVLSNNERTEDNEEGEMRARQYLEERQHLKQKKTKLEQKIRHERQCLQEMEDNVWSLQTRSMELNEQMRGEVKT